MPSDMVVLSKNGPIVTVTLQRPPANAMNIELTEHLAQIFDGAASDSSIRRDNRGRRFCIGGWQITPVWVQWLLASVFLKHRLGERFVLGSIATD